MKKSNFNEINLEIAEPEPNYASKEEVINELEKLIKKKYASIYDILNRFIYSRTGRNNVNGLTADDIISKACLKFIDDELPDKRRRRWNKAKYKDFEKAFMNACFSLISNEIKKFNKSYGDNDFDTEQKELIENDDDTQETNDSELKRIVDAQVSDENNNDDEDRESFKRDYYDVDESLSVQRKIYSDYQMEYYSEKDEFTDEEMEEIIEIIRSKIMELDEGMLKVFDAILEGERKDKELAEKFNLPIKKVRYYKKRIKHYTLEILGELKNERKIS